MDRDPKRISEIMSLLGEYWTLNPFTMDMRLGQIMSNITYSKFGYLTEKNIFYVEDEDIIEELKKNDCKSKRWKQRYVKFAKRKNHLINFIGPHMICRVGDVII